MARRTPRSTPEESKTPETAPPDNVIDIGEVANTLPRDEHAKLKANGKAQEPYTGPYRHPTVKLDRRPPAFQIAEKYEWITASGRDCEEFEGFSIYVKTSITVAESRKVREEHEFISGPYLLEWEAMDPKNRDPRESPREKEKALLAPHIYGWNAQEVNPQSGEWEDIPSPREAGPEIFDRITDEMVTWMTRIVVIGYLVTGKVRRSLDRSGSIGDTSEDEEDTSD